MEKNIPRILITAPASGTGKTTLTCGLLAALKKRGLKMAAFKCGPDYIDPMFHREVLGIDSYNLDSFLCGRENLLKLFTAHMRERDMAVIEGVMGYYDGIGGISTQASAYEVADATDSPVVLLVDGKGVSVSIVPYIQGFLKYKEQEAKDSHIQGVIFNRLSPMMYERMRRMVETETGIKVYGYVPDLKDFVLESRHLGLKMPGEIEGIRKKIHHLGELLEQTLDIDGLIQMAAAASAYVGKCIENTGENKAVITKKTLKIGVARDEAFCFLYPDNLSILEKMGAELIDFSPLHDAHLPDGINGLLLYGGYPELFAENLSENRSMRSEIREAVRKGMPCIAECGGFQYLQEYMKTDEGGRYEMCGVFPGGSYPTGSLKRFGYVTLAGGSVFGKNVGEIPAHEFHYYDSENCGEDFSARKPLSERNWKCMISTETLLAGYPHIHYAGNPQIAACFLEACGQYKRVSMGKDRKDDCKWESVF